jgi:hypothetical protein
MDGKSSIRINFSATDSYCDIRINFRESILAIAPELIPALLDEDRRIRINSGAIVGKSSIRINFSATDSNGDIKLNFRESILSIAPELIPALLMKTATLKLIPALLDKKR